MAPYLSKYKRFHIHIICYTMTNISNSDVVIIYSSNEVSYSAGCSSTRLTNFPRYVSGGSSIGRTRRTPPPPVIGENIEFSCIFFNKVKLTPLFQPKCGLRPLLLHILDPSLYVHVSSITLRVIIM